MIEYTSEQEKIIIEMMQDSFIKYRLDFALDSKSNKIRDNLKTLFAKAIDKIKDHCNVNDLSSIIKTFSVADNFCKYLNILTKDIKYLKEEDLFNSMIELIIKHFSYIINDITYREKLLTESLDKCHPNVIKHFYKQIADTKENSLNKLLKLYKIQRADGSDYKISEKVEWLEQHKEEIERLYQKNLADNVNQIDGISYINKVIISKIKKLENKPVR